MVVDIIIEEYENKDKKSVRKNINKLFLVWFIRIKLNQQLSKSACKFNGSIITKSKIIHHLKWSVREMCTCLLYTSDAADD